jgi:hypothetical protein
MGPRSASLTPSPLCEVPQDAKVIVNIASAKVRFIGLLPCVLIILQRGCGSGYATLTLSSDPRDH